MNGANRTAVRIGAGVLVAVGALIVAVSASFTGAFVLGAVLPGLMRSPLDGLGRLLLVLIVGGVPFAIGFAMFRWGAGLFRKTRPTA